MLQQTALTYERIENEASMAQSIPYGTRFPEGTSEHDRGVSDQLGNATAAAAGDTRNSAQELARDIAETVKNRPLTALALTAGFAFAVGALWKLGRSSHAQSRRHSMLAHLPNTSTFRRTWL